MKKSLRKSISLLLILILLVGMIPTNLTFAHEDSNTNNCIINVDEKSDGDFLIGDNGYIKYYANKTTGGFYILPSNQPFDELKEASFGSFRLNGDEFIFGGNYPDSSFVMPPIINHGGTCQAVWQINGVNVYQFINIVKNGYGNNSYAVYIRYEFESAYEDVPLDTEIEGRILIDTMFGIDDSLPVSIAGGMDSIVSEIVFSGDNMPTFYEVDSLFGNTGPKAYGLLIDESVTSPSALTFACFDNVKDTVFDYTHDENVIFTGDSSVLLYFNGKNETNSEIVYFSTIYGFDDLYPLHTNDLYDTSIEKENNRMAAGGSHTLFIDEDGSLWAWGSSDSGQIGNGSAGFSRPIPVRVMENIVSVAAGGSHTLAIDANGTLWAWGGNYSGQLGNGSISWDVNEPKPVKVMEDVVSVAAGGEHSLAIDKQGNLWAWESNSNGQVGNGSINWDINEARPVKVMEDIVSIAAGGNHSLAIDKQGNLWAWGKNWYGQVGNDGLDNEPKPVKVMEGVVGIAAGGDHSLAIDKQSYLWTWGSNQSGQLGNGSIGWDATEPKPVKVMEDVVSVAAGGEHSLAIDIQGNLWTWGSNYYGQVGDSTTENNRDLPVKVMEGVVSMTAGSEHSLTIDRDGEIWSWGSNSYGQLGNGNSGWDAADSRPRRIKLIFVENRVASVAAGSGHTLAIDVNGSLWAWGDNSYGQTGIDSTQLSVDRPVNIMDGVVSVAAGGEHSLAIDEESNLWAWGANYNGQIGDGSTTHRSTPVKVMENIVSVAAGLCHTLAIDIEGNLWAWGANELGQLGYGYLGDNETKPEKVMENVISVVAGSFHSLAIDVSGNMWSWGANEYGQLGYGYSGKPEAEPVKVMENIVSVVAGSFHSLTIDKDSNLWAWGANEYGQLGNGSSGMDANESKPVKVMGNALSATAGYAHTLAIDINNNLWAWGSNSSNQLGIISMCECEGDCDCSNTPITSPVKVFEGNLVSVEAFDDHSLAIDADGSLWDWGCDWYKMSFYFNNIRNYWPISISPKLSVLSVGEGITVQPSFIDAESVFDIHTKSHLYIGQHISMNIYSDGSTAVESVKLKDSLGNDVPFEGFEFVMPFSNITLEVTSAKARKIGFSSAVQSLFEDSKFSFAFIDGLNNFGWWFDPDYFVFAAGSRVSMYIKQQSNMIPNNVSIIGSNSSRGYAIEEISVENDGDVVYVYEFTMPDEDLIIDFSTNEDPNYKFSLVPHVTSNRGALSFAADSITTDLDGTIRILPDDTVTVSVSGIDYVHYDFYGIKVKSIGSGNEYPTTAVIPEVQYTFTMPKANIYVELDVRQKTTYRIDNQIDKTVAQLEVKNERSGSSINGYAGDKITFGITNRNEKNIFESVQLLNAETLAVIQTFNVNDEYTDYYPGEFVMPAHGVVLRALFADAPSVPIIVDSLPTGVTIVPSSNHVLFGDTVHFDFTTSDTRYMNYRPVLRAYDNDVNILYEEYFQRENGLTSAQAISFISGIVRRTGGVPAKIVIGVYEIPFSYIKEMTSIRPNSDKAELFNEIIVTGRNLYEGDEGVVFIGTSPHSMQPAIMLSHDFDTIRIHVPENMRPTDEDITYYVRINDVEKSCTVTVDRLLRRSPFGHLAVVSDKANRHSIIVADSDAELRQLAESNNIILRMQGDVKYNQPIDAYEFAGGDVLINNFVTFSIIDDNPLIVRQTDGNNMQTVYGVKVSGAKGKLSVPGKTFINGESIEINLQHSTKYIDTWAKNDSGNLIRMGEENIIIEYTKFDMGFAVWSNGIVGECSDAVILKDSIVESGKGYFGFGLAEGIQTEGVDWFKQFLAVDVQRVVWAPKTVGGNYILQGIEAQGKASVPDNFLFGVTAFGFNATDLSIDVYINTFDRIYRVDSAVQVPALANAEFYASIGFVASTNGSFPLDSFYFIAKSDMLSIPIFPPFAKLTGYGGGMSGISSFSNNNYVANPLRLNLYGILELVKLFEFDPIKMSIGAGEITFDAKAYIKVGNVKFDVINRFDGGIYFNNGFRFDVNLDAVFVKGFDVINGGGHANLEYINGRFCFSGLLFVRIQVPKIHVISIWIPPYWVFTGKWYQPWKGYWVAARWEPVYIGPFTLMQLQANMSDTSASAFFNVIGYGLRADYVYGGTPTVREASKGISNSLEKFEYLYDDDGTYIGYVTYGSNLSIAAVPRTHGSNSIMAMNAQDYEDWIAIDKVVIEGGIDPDDGEYYEGFEYEDWSKHFITFPDNIASHVDDYALMITASSNDIRIKDSNGNPFILKYAADVGNVGLTEDDLNKAGVNAVVISGASDGHEQDGLKYGQSRINDDDPFNNDAVTIMIRLPKEAGEWVVESSMPFASSIIRVAPLPEIDEVLFDGNDKITWNTKNLNTEDNVYVLEVRMSTDDGMDIANVDPGVLIDEIIIDNNAVSGSASGTYTIDLSKIKDFESGEYYPRLVLLAIPRHEYRDAGNKITDETNFMPQHSMTAKTPLIHTNINEPLPVASITASSGGGGTLRVEWKAADNKADGYYIKILGANGNPIFIESDVFDEHGDVVDVSLSPVVYDVTNDSEENGAFSVLLGGMQTGAIYQVEVIPYVNIPNVVDGEVFNSTIRGVSTLSNTVELPVPNFPVINTALPSSEVLTDGMGNRIIYVNSDFAFGLSSNQKCQFTVLQNGEVIYQSSGYEATSTVNVSMAELTMSSIQITAVNREGDKSFSNFMVYFDDIPPVLNIITNEESIIFANQLGQYVIRGYSEPGSVITDDLGNTTRVDANGEFFLKGVLPFGADDTLRSITASDQAGNFVTVDIMIKSFEGIIDLIEGIEIIPKATVLLREGEGFSLNARAILANSEKIDLPPNSVTYNVLDGSSHISINEETGRLTAINGGISVIEVSLSDGSKSFTSNVLTVFIIASDVPVPEYELTIVSSEGGRIITGSNGMYNPSDRIELEAAADPGYVFSGWIATAGSFADAGSPTTSFTMPVQDATITATWKNFTVETSSIDVTAENLIRPITVGGSATGEITLSNWSPVLPTGISATVTANGTSADVVFTDTRGSGAPLVNYTGTVTLTRSGVSATPPLNVTINLPEVLHTFTVETPSINVTAGNLARPIIVGGTATGDINLSNWSPVLPTNISAAVTTNGASTDVVFTDMRGAGAPLVNYTGTVTLTRGGISATPPLNVSIDLPALPHTFTVETSSINIADGNLTRPIATGGSATGEITLSNWNPVLPTGISASVITNGTTADVVFTDARVAGTSLVNYSGTVILTRSDISATPPLNVSINLPAAPHTFTVETSSINITAGSLTQPITVGGSATNEITLSNWNPALPTGISASVTANGTTADVVFTDIRGAGAPLVNYTGTVTLTRSGISATPPLNVTINLPATEIPKSINIGPQTGTVNSGTGGSVTYTVTTANITNGSTITLNGAPTGVTLSTTATINNSTTMAINVSAAVAANTYPLTVTIDGVTSSSFSLVILTSGALKEVMPVATIDYINEMFIGLTANAAYTVNEAEKTSDSSGKIAIDPAWLGQTVNIIKKGIVADNTIDSDPQVLPIPSRPAAPTPGKTDTTGGSNNGSITGIDDTIEYKANAASTWTAVSGNSVTGLEADTYNVRIKATATAFASESANVIIASSNADLSSLLVSSVTLTPAFNTATTNYTAPVGNSVSSITITATASNTNATVNGDGIKSLNIGENIITIVVTAEDGTTQKVYTITITRESGGGSSVGTSVTNYTISFNSNGGSTISNQTVAAGGRATKPADPVREDYKFEGWYSDAALTTLYDFTSTVNRNITLYAKWDEIIIDPDKPLDWINPYLDVTGANWFYEAVRFVSVKGLMNGMSKDKFSPNTSLTRAMIVTILWRLEGEPAAEGMYADFSDVVQGSWYEKAVGWAAENEIVLGYPGGFFKPNGPVIREEVMTILYRYAKYKELDTSATTDLSDYADMGNISSWALDAMRWAVAEGIIQGRTPTTIVPQGISTRAEIAMIFKRYIEDFLDKVD